MELSIIPWQVFLDALHKQQSGTLELWLRSWLFSNEGVMLADDSFRNDGLFVCSRVMTKVSATAKWLGRMSNRPDKNLPAWRDGLGRVPRPKQNRRELNSPATIRWLVVDRTERELRELKSR